jgi:ureidoglycolate lyase
MRYELLARPLDRKSFAPFGDVIETDGARHYTINAGWAERYHDLAALDLTAGSGRPAVSIFRAKPRPEPIELTLMERHALGSQTFVPLSDRPFLIVVAPPGSAPSGPDDLFVFVTNGKQGVSYRPGVWHHPLLAVGATSDFLVIDRIGPEADCDEVLIDGWAVRLATLEF